MKFKHLVSICLSFAMVVSNAISGVAADNNYIDNIDISNDKLVSSTSINIDFDNSAEDESAADAYYIDFSNRPSYTFEEDIESYSLSDSTQYYDKLGSNGKIIYDAINTNMDYNNISTYTINYSNVGPQVYPAINMEFLANSGSTSGGYNFDLYYDEVNEVSYDSSGNVDNIMDAVMAYKDDNPQLFWITNAWLVPWCNSRTNKVTRIEIHWITGVTAEHLSTITEYSSQYEIWKNNLVNGANAYTKDYDKIKYIHDTIASQTTYDNESLRMYDFEDPERYGLAHNVSGIFVNGACVCEGYAKAFKIICNEVGIDCVIQSGDGIYSSSGHAWNLVELNDKWYYVDITWDDSNDNLLKYTYFLSGNDSFASSEHNKYDYSNDLGLNISDSDYDLNKETTTTEATTTTTTIDTSKVQISVVNATVDLADKTFGVDINVDSNPGIASLGFNVAYDSSAMQLTSVTNGTLFADAEMAEGDKNKNPYTVSYMTTSANKTGTGKLITLNFTLTDSCEVGLYPITLSKGDRLGGAYSIYEKEVDLILSTGASVTVTDKSIISGDVNGDGVLNRNDLLRLGKYFAGWNVDVNKSASDVNGDGNFNRNDLLRLGKYFAGWKVTLG